MRVLYLCHRSSGKNNSAISREATESKYLVFIHVLLCHSYRYRPLYQFVWHSIMSQRMKLVIHKRGQQNFLHGIQTANKIVYGHYFRELIVRKHLKPFTVDFRHNGSRHIRTALIGWIRRLHEIICRWIRISFPLLRMLRHPCIGYLLITKKWIHATPLYIESR